MTETRQTALFGLLTLTLVAACGTLAASFQILNQQRLDNQTISALHTAVTVLKDTSTTLRAQVSDLQTQLHDTEMALDKAALTGLHLGEENETLRARVETAERKARL